jgi:glycosyltransferase involved in cell wall biosynthesis
VAARALDIGGSQLRMAELVDRLQRSGHFQSTVLSPVDGPLRERLEAAGATVRIAPQPPLNDPTSYEQSVVELCCWIDGRFDVVFGATVTNFPAVDAAIRLGLPSILRVGEAAPLSTVAAWLFGELDLRVQERARWAMENASLVLSNSAAAVRMYRSLAWKGNYLVVPTGTDLGAARRARRRLGRAACRGRLGVEPEERLLVCAGTVWPVKGQATLVQAIDLLRRTGLRLSCALVGAAEPGYERAIIDFVVRHDLVEAVRLVPFTSNLEWWWRAADVAVCCSETEAFPAVAIEAMAHGLPLLGTRVGDLPDLVEPGVTGWLCEPSDLRSMTEALSTVALTPAATLRTIGAAASRAVRPYDRTRLVESTAELVRHVALGTRPQSAVALTHRRRQAPDPPFSLGAGPRR